MFIKRINKIYAPPKTTTNPRKKTAIQGEQKQTGAKFADKGSEHYEIPLKVFFMCVDPHARLISLYCQQYDTIYVVSVLTLLDFIRGFRQQYLKTKSYSFKSNLKPELVIQNPRPSLHIFQIKFSHSIQGTQFLVVTYYSGVIDIYSVLSGKKIDGLDIVERSLHLNEVTSPIYNVNVIGHSIFISTYDGKLLCYEGRQLGVCLKFEDEWVRLCYDYQQEEEDSRGTIRQNQKQSIRKLKKFPLFQDKNNILKLGNNVIQKRPQKRVSSQNQKKSIQKQRRRSTSKKFSQLTESYEQYLKLESQKLCPEGTHKKYTLSLCERYLICRNEQELIIGNQFICSIYYTIRAREHGWLQFDQTYFCHPPAINQFWGLNVHSKGIKLKDEHNLLQYCINSKQILIATIGNYEYQDGQPINNQGLTDQRSITVIKLQRSGHLKLKPVIVGKLVDNKEDITEIQWIGPNILLYLGEKGNLYYLEINPALMID